MARFGLPLVAFVTLVIGTACGSSSNDGSGSPTGPTQNPPPVQVTYTVEVSRPASVQLETRPPMQNAAVLFKVSLNVTGGGARGESRCTFRVAENDSPRPVDRLNFSYDFFANTQPIVREHVERFTHGLDRPLSGSVECKLSGNDARGQPIDLTRQLTVGPDVVAPLTLPCVPNDQTLCIFDRFQVNVGSDGPGGPVFARVPANWRYNDGAYFVFDNPNSWDVFVQMFNRCQQNNVFWVNLAGNTNREFTVEIIDTRTGISRSFFNPANQPFQPVLDTSAFATCP